MSPADVDPPQNTAPESPSATSADAAANMRSAPLGRDVPEDLNPVDAARMPIGDHLDELRKRVARSVIALLVACLIFVYPAGTVLSWIVRPVILALRKHGQPETLLQTSPTELITIYLKVIILLGSLTAAPFILYQMWLFVAAGLYPNERKWLTRLIPYSVGLFFTGVAFMYSIVLLVSLNFLVGFGSWITLPPTDPSGFEQRILGSLAPQVETTPADESRLPDVPFVAEDPSDPAPGAVWFNVTQHKLKVRGEDQIWATPLVPEGTRALVTTHFKIGDYLSFVMVMTLAFGLAFQMPIVVLAVTKLGIATPQQLGKQRKFVIMGILVIGGVIAPPEIFSHLLLAGPMILLFEVGLLLARRQVASRTDASDAA